MKGMHGELLSIAAVLAVLLGFAAVFPYEAIGFVPARDSDAVREGLSSASIVFLDEAAVARAVRTTRILSRGEGDGRVRADLLAPELPDADPLPMMPLDVRSRSKAPSVVECGIPPFQPSLRAPPPVRIAAEQIRDEPPFPRNELLKLN